MPILEWENGWHQWNPGTSTDNRGCNVSREDISLVFLRFLQDDTLPRHWHHTNLPSSCYGVIGGIRVLPPLVRPEGRLISAGKIRRWMIGWSSFLFFTEDILQIIRRLWVVTTTRTSFLWGNTLKWFLENCSMNRGLSEEGENKTKFCTVLSRSR